jgi:large repetitive protein
MRRAQEGLRAVRGLAAVAAVLALSAAPASAQPVTCGQVITEDTTLDADLHCDTAVALVVGAAGVTLDLGGHTVFGQSHAVLNDGHDRVTIRNGTALSDEGPPIELRGVAGGVISGVTVSGLNRGIRLSDSDRNRLVRNEIFGGIVLVDGSDRNTIARNHWPFGEDGLWLDGSSDNRIHGNDFAGIDGYPIRLMTAHRNRIAGNTVRSLVNGIRLEGSHANGLVDNFIAPRAPFQAHGPELRDSNRNLLARNTIAGVFLGAWIVSGEDNVLRRNVVVAGDPYEFNPTEPDGIRVEAGAARTALTANTASGFPDDGIDAEAPGTLIGRNTANDNGDLGIEAVPGVIDLGGNRASGNGNPLQCLNVVCH